MKLPATALSFNYANGGRNLPKQAATKRDELLTLGGLRQEWISVVRGCDSDGVLCWDTKQGKVNRLHGLLKQRGRGDGVGSQQLVQAILGHRRKHPLLTLQEVHEVQILT